jgi:hypothetical protein
MEPAEGLFAFACHVAQQQLLLTTEEVTQRHSMEGF